MKPKSYLSSQLEVRSALSGELSRLFVPVKPQPFIDERGHICRTTKKGTVNYGKTLEDNPALKNFAQCCAPYPPESLIYFREKWRLYYYVDEQGYTKFDRSILEYAADRPPMIPQKDGDGFQMFNRDGSEKFIPWKSAATMPQAAARIYATLGEPTVELVEGIWKWAYPATVISTTGKPE